MLALALLPHLFFQVAGPAHGGWSSLLRSSGLQEGQPATVVVVRPGAGGSAASWRERAEAGGLLILEGASDIAASFGFEPGAARVLIRSVEDVHAPAVRIVWQQPQEEPVFRLPPGAEVFARERWERAPLAAGFRVGSGAVLWVATAPGERGYERYPYLPHALTALGLQPPFQSRRLWAFFDSSYRLRVDPDYFAARWRDSGIAALHIAAWHYFEPDPERDAWLRALIEACHRQAILAYAWLELPHVSEEFWRAHPEWREQTALGQDAHLDWRKLMNLLRPECRRAVLHGVQGLLERFDWDGVNLAELYFESLEGAANPSRFTPMNPDVRREFQAAGGFDPLELFRPGVQPDPARLRAFLDWRAGLAQSLQAGWIEDLEAIRRTSPHLDLVLTHIDDRFEPGMRDALGADAAAVLPLLERYNFTFLIEDPATVWHLGPQRYPEIAKRYQPLTPYQQRLAIDLNIVERYQDVYPTRQQTGAELYQLVHQAAAAFPRVAVYFESSILPVDRPLLAAAGSPVSRVERVGERLAVTARAPVRVRWSGPAQVDGRPWPAADAGVVQLPAGTHILEPGTREPDLHLLDFSGDLRGARALPGAMEFSYQSGSRAFAVLDRQPAALELDGTAAPPELLPSPGGRIVLTLPRGQHVVRVGR